MTFEAVRYLSYCQCYKLLAYAFQPSQENPFVTV